MVWCRLRTESSLAGGQLQLRTADLLLWVRRISGGQALPHPFASRELLSSLRAEGQASPAKHTAFGGMEKLSLPPETLAWAHQLRARAPKAWKGIQATRAGF